jgi:iron complex outermembrane receptor protein
MYAQYAKGFIIPALSASLESLGANPGAPVDPAPTKTTNYQAGIVYAGDRLNIDFDGYYIQASNSTFVDPTNPGVLQFNADPAIYEGAEGQVSYVVAKGLTAIANGTIMISKDAGGQAAPLNGKWLPNAPNYTAMLGAVYSSGRFKLSYLHKFTGHQWIDAANTARLGAYSYGVLSGSVTYGRITAGVTVNNPLNSRPITSQSGAPSASTLYIYQAPASYEAQLKIRF